MTNKIIRKKHGLPFLFAMVVFFFAVFFILTPASFAMIVDGVAAKVNEEIITLSELNQRVDEIVKRKKITSASERKKVQGEILNGMIEDKLLLIRAQEEGITAEEKDVDEALNDLKKKNNVTDDQFKQWLKRNDYTMEKYRQELKNQIILSKITSMEIRSQIKVSEKDINKYYNQHKDDFTQKEEVKASHILIAFKEDVSREKCKETAYEIYSRLKKGENFASLARLYSDDTTSSEGGDLGFFTKGMMVSRFEKVAFRLKVGEFSKPVRTDFGYHLIKVTAKKEPTPIPVEEARKKIEEILYNKKGSKKFKDVLEELRAKSYVEIMIDSAPVSRVKNHKRTERKKSGSPQDSDGKIAAMIKKTVLKWKHSIEKEDIRLYASCYSEHFRSGKKNRKDWVSMQKKSNKENDHIEVAIRELRITRKNSLYIATFGEKFSSSEKKVIISRRLYIRLEENEAKIVGEKWLKPRQDFEKFSKKPLFTSKSKVHIMGSS